MSTYDELFLNAMQNNNSDETKDDQNGLMTGTIISKGESEYFISVGGKSEIVLPFSETVDSFKVGDSVLVVSTGVKDGIPQASQKKAKYREAQENVHKAFLDHSSVLAKIEKIITNQEGQNSGFTVSINGVEAFLPLSQIFAAKDLNTMIGKKFDVAVIKHERNRIVVSEKIVREQRQKENFEQFQTTYHIGSILAAEADVVNDTFALVKIANITGFMPIQEFDWKYINNLKDVLKRGDKFDVKILEIDPAKKSVKVSRKLTIQNPTDLFFKTYNVGDNVTGKTVRFGKNFAIIESQCGTELFLPVSEMSWTSKVHDPQKILTLGDRVEIKIKDMDSEKKRIVVSLRELLENPWSNANQKFALGTKHHGTIASITDFGIFVSFEDGIQGIIRKEDIDWENPNINLHEKFKKNDPITATVLHVDEKNEKLRLGIKQLSKNPYQNFADNYSAGSVVEGEVVDILNDRVIVQVEGALKAFIHVSQLSTEHVQDPKSICKIGDQLKASLRKLNIAQQTIELSIRDIVKFEEKKELDQYLNQNDVQTPTLGALFGNILKK